MRTSSLILALTALCMSSLFSQGFNVPSHNWGLSIGGLGMGAGGSATGINLSLLGVGAGDHLKGISLAGLGVGAPSITGIQAALVSGGVAVTGITIAPAYFRVKGEENPYMKGLSVSAFNHIQGEQFGVAIGIFNYAHSVRGFQLGVLNHVKNNPGGLRWLPVFNTSFQQLFRYRSIQA